MKIILKKVDEGEERIGAVHKDLKAEKKKHEAKSAFLSNIGHDIRTPMNAIMGCVALCKKEDATLPEIRENAAKIERSCQHLLSLVNDVLEMSRLFDAFEMERSSSLSGVQGVGLGMAITKRIVDQMSPSWP